MSLLPRLRELSERSSRLREFSEEVVEPVDLGDSLKDLAALFRGLQLYAHNAHNLASGQSFFEDHEFLGELYATYEAAYDKLVELMIGENQAPDLQELQKKAVSMMDGMPRLPLGDVFLELGKGEGRIQHEINELAASVSDQGILQTIGTLAEESKERAYKIGQRFGIDRYSLKDRSAKDFATRLRELSMAASRLREFDSRPRNSNGQYEPNIESGMTPDAMHAAYGTQDPQQNIEAIDERVGGGESLLSRKIRAYRTKGIKAPAGEEAPGGDVGSGSTTL